MVKIPYRNYFDGSTISFGDFHNEFEPSIQGIEFQSNSQLEWIRILKIEISLTSEHLGFRHIYQPGVIYKLSFCLR